MLFDLKGEVVTTCMLCFYVSIKLKVQLSIQQCVSMKKLIDFNMELWNYIYVLSDEVNDLNFVFGQWSWKKNSNS